MMRVVISIVAALLAVQARADYVKNVSAVIHFTLQDASDGSLVSSGTPVIYITKDGGAQAAATNAAVSEGGGQWSVVLTAAELNATTVGVMIVESGSAPVSYQLATTSADAAAVLAEASAAKTAALSAATDAGVLKTDWANGGRLDLILDEVLTWQPILSGQYDVVDLDLSTLLLRLTANRAGYLDKLNVSGTLAHSDAAATYRADVSGLATQASVNLLPTAAANAAAVRSELATELGRIDAAISSRLPSSGYVAPPSAVDYVTALSADAAYQSLLADAQSLNDVKLTTARANRLDYLDMPLSGVGGAGQPRINEPPASAYTVKVATRSDGTHVCPTPIRIRPGATNVAIGIDMSPMYGEVRVANVGAPTVSGGNVTATALGPHDWIAMVQLGGTATAGERRTISVPITMRTGEVELVDVKLWVFAE
jgi:hypothetical protein